MTLRGALARSITNQSPVPLTLPNARSSWSMSWGNRGSRDEELMATTSTVGTVFGIVNKLSTATAKANWHLYRTAKSGLKEDRVKVTSHACIDLFKRPNPVMNERRFVETVQQHIELTGEGDTIISHFEMGPKNIPVELWPVRPDRITPIPDPYEFLVGYVYTSPGGERVPLGKNECLQLLMPNPRDPYRGLGPVQSILTDIDSVRYSAEWNRAFFTNSAEPGGVIEVTTELSDPQFNQMQARWAEGHKGVSKAHRVAILEAGAKWVTNSFSQRDMQFAELRSVGRDVIMEAWGFPRPMLGITDDVNRAVAEAGEYVFAKWLIEERLDRWKDWRNDVLALYGNTGVGLEWDYDSPVPSNSDQENAALKTKSDALVAVSQAGGDWDDCLEWLSLPKIGFTQPEPTVTRVALQDPKGGVAQ